MRLGAPGFLWFLICRVLGVLAVVSKFKFLPYVTANQFWFAVAAWALLSFGCIFRLTRA